LPALCGDAEALADLDTFASRIPGAECTSVFCAIVDPAVGTVTYSCARHPPPILVTAGQDYRLLDQAPSLPLAMLPADWRRSQAPATLPPGATLLLYTDGVVDAESRTGQRYGLDRLCRAPRANAESAHSLIDSVLADIDAFTGGHPLGDDLTLVAVQVESRRPPDRPRDSRPPAFAPACPPPPPA